MHTFHKKYSIAILLIILFFLPALSFAEGVGSFSRVEGRVDILYVGATSVVPVKSGDSVSMGDIVRTKSDGKAEINFRDETVIRIAPGSRLKIDEYTFNPDKTRDKGALSLLRGKVRAIVTKTKGGLIPVAAGTSTFTIQTPTAIAGVKGSDIFVFHERGVTGVLFREGHGFVYNINMPERIVDINPGQATFVMRPDAAPLPPRQAMDVEFFNHMRDTTLREVEAQEGEEVPAAEDMIVAGSETGFDFKPQSETETEYRGPEPVIESEPLPLLPVTETHPETLKDTSPPVITLTPSAFPSEGTEIAVGISTNEPAIYSYNMDGAGWNETTSPIIEYVPEGSHTLEIQATDASGNIASASLPFDLDEYGLSGNFWGCIGNVTGSTYGYVAGISGQDWGGWDMYMYGTGNIVPNATWTLYAGGTSYDYSTPSNDGGYWIEIAPGTSNLTTQILSGTSTLRYLSHDRIGLGTGTITGNYDGLGGYSLSDIGRGTYTETPLTFVSDVYGDLNTVTKDYNGQYNYADGGFYQYNYYGNNGYGSQYYYRTSLGQYFITYYYSDGTTYTYDYNTGIGTYGTWDTATSLSFLAVPPDSVYDYSYNNNYVVDYYDGYLSALLGGTQSLWSGSNIPFTFMGSYTPSTTQPHLFNTDIYSYNYKNSTNTTYDNGAYYGFTAGTEINNVMDGRLYALYIDDLGRAGYLRGSLSGLVYPEISMFEMDGTINRNQMTTGTGFTADQLYNNVWLGYGGDGTISGAFGGTGSSIDGYDNGLYTYSIVDFANNTAENWGIYNQKFTGSFTNPNADTGWTARLGGYDSMGAVNPYIYYSGQYTYVDGGYYEYAYYSNNGYGYQYYNRSSTGEAYQIYYYNDGTSYTYDVNTGIGTYGTWDPQTYNVSSLATPIDSANATPSSSYSYTNGSDDYGYWIMDATGGAWSGDKLTASVSGRYMTPYKMGDITGEMLGTYDAAGGVWQGINMGAYNGTPLAWSGKIDYDYNDNGLYDNGDGIMGRGDTYGGLVGGIQSPWSSTTPLTLMGPYWGPSSTDIGPFMWNAPIYSWNVNTGQYLTYDGGAFWGLTGGMWWDSDNNSTTTNDRNIDASIYSIYIDPSGNAGILRGSLAGNYYPEISKFRADGTWTPTVLATGLDPAILGSLTYSPNLTWWTSGLAGAGSFTAGGSISEGQTRGSGYSISGQDWGICQALTAGSYSGTTSDTWDFSFNYIDFLYTNIIGTQTDGSKWSNGVLAGKTYGYGANITNTPMTWISAGETIGTFDANSLTWQAVQTGAWLETTKFLAMAADSSTGGGQARLSQLNIPFVEVGKATLTDQGTGTLGGMSATAAMNDVTFFAYSNGAAPKIWATGDIQGSYTCTSCYGGTIPVAGNGLTANINVQTFDTLGQKWIATVDGSGTLSGGSYSGSTTFNGVAAGGINNTNSTFSGTGAGVAK